MMIYTDEKTQKHFRDNLIDWYTGGPKEGGWTRAGIAIDPVEVRLLSAKKDMIPVDEVLAKNRDEVTRWHLAFLDGEPQAYFSEYLDTRYDEIKADERAKSFLDLLEDMRENGFNPNWPVHLADVSSLNLGFKYFRFDGCHRTCCAKHLGITEVPALIFSIEVSPKV